MNPILEGRIIVVAPRLFDAVLSLGATIANASRRGAKVDIVTVFSSRNEDLSACALLGASPYSLSSSDKQHDVSNHQLVNSVAELAEGADVIAIPGISLSSAQHTWVSEILLREGLDCNGVALYAEQPAWFVQRRYNCVLSASAQLQPFLDDVVRWSWHGGTTRDRNAKREAARLYHSRLTRMPFNGLNRLLGFELAMGGEPLGWIS